MLGTSCPEIKSDFDYAADVGCSADEDVVWRDSDSPLTVSQVGVHPNRHYRLRPGDWMYVDVLGDNRLLSRARIGTDPANCEHFVADQVIPRSLAHQGKLVLHAAAVAVNDGAILLMGASGRGKSTLSASFASVGHTLLGDDAIIITRSLEGAEAEAVYPSLRLLPDSIAAVMPSHTRSTPMSDYSSKRRIGVAGSTGPLATRAAFVLADSSKDRSVGLRRLSVAQACMTFLENSFALDPGEVTRARDRLGQASALARAVPAFELSYARDYGRLAEVRAAILGQLAELVAE